ncbi:RHOMBOID-like protein 5 [Corylus avellana]|uniref:RHOMBOID-like protein 5 n=1 Tax=Corylus avellana TaxID=13451 RepID=UPI001E218C38|nr:RHOMBOID-like protein 5 [Corylus avellana]
MGKRPPPPCDIECGPLKARPPPPPAPYFHPPAPEPWFSWLVPLIFAANFTIFAYTMYVNDCPAHTGEDRCLLGTYLGRFSFQPLRENPLLGPSTTTLIQLGGLEKKLVVEKDEGWRLLSCMWLHVGVVHLIANMLSLLFIGIRLEQEFGFVRIGVLYLLSGFGGSLLSALNSKSSISVGASGALFGLLGAMLSELLTNWTIYANKCAALVTLVVIIALNLAVGFLPRVDNSAHIGGFVSGFLLGFILLVRPQFGFVSRKYIPPGYDIKRIPRHKWYQYLFWISALLLLIVGYGYCCVMLFKGGTMTYSLSL